MTLKEAAFRQVVWSISELVFSQSFQFIIKIVLARLLFPADFGLLAMSMVIIQGLNVVLSLGMQDAVIQRKELEQTTITTIFWTEFIWGTLLSIISFLSAPVVGIFFGDERVVPLVRFLSLNLFFSAMSFLPSGLLERNMRFFWRGFANSASIFVFGTASIFMALNGMGYWSLAVGQVAQSIVQSTLLLLFARPKIMWHFSINEFCSVFRFGKHMILVNVFAWFLAYVDNAFVGRLLGDASLGYYVLAFSIAELPVRGIHIINSVFYSVYAKLQDNYDLLRKTLGKSLRICVLFLLPIIVFTIVESYYFIPLLIGEKWSPIVPLLIVFMFYSLFRALAGVIGYVLQAVNKAQTVWQIQVIEVIFVLVALYPAIKWFGLMGVALTMTFERFFAFLLYQFAASRFVGYTFSRLFSALRMVPCAITVGAVMYGIDKLIDNSLLSVIGSVAAGGLIYTMFLYVFESDLINECILHSHSFISDLYNRVVLKGRFK